METKKCSRNLGRNFEFRELILSRKYIFKGMNLACVPTDEAEFYVGGLTGSDCTLFYEMTEWSQPSKYSLEVEPVF